MAGFSSFLPTVVFLVFLCAKEDLSRGWIWLRWTSSTPPYPRTIMRAECPNVCFHQRLLRQLFVFMSGDIEVPGEQVGDWVVPMENCVSLVKSSSPSVCSWKSFTSGPYLCLSLVDGDCYSQSTPSISAWWPLITHFPVFAKQEPQTSRI